MSEEDVHVQIGRENLSVVHAHQLRSASAARVTSGEANDDAERRRLLTQREPRLYTRRWYVLGLFAAVTFTQGVVWNTWGPLAQSGRRVFGWQDADIALLANWGCAMYLLTCAPFSYLMDAKGLRAATVVTTALIFAGAAIRCVVLAPPAASRLVHLGQALNALAGPVCFGGPPLLSDVWFPPGQRSTATAVTVMSSYLGVAIAYLLGITFVKEETGGDGKNQSHTFSNISGDPVQERSEIRTLLITECVFAGLIFALVLLYFPARPPSPPSISAALPRLSYRIIVPRLLKNGPLWLIVGSGAMASGVFGSWLSLLDTLLNPFGFSQREAGMLGVYSSLAACLAAMFISRFSDVFSRKIRLILIVTSVLGAAFYLVFTLTCETVIPFNTVVVYLGCIAGSMVVNAAIPLYYEFVCDCAYPIPEGASATFLTIGNNAIGLLFYVVLQFPSSGTRWMNWVLIGAVGVGALLLPFARNAYGRSRVDQTDQQIPEPGDTDKR